MRIHSLMPELERENDVLVRFTKSPIMIHTGFAIHPLSFLRRTPPCQGGARPNGQHGGGRERPPSSRSRYGHGDGWVFTTTVPPRVGSFPSKLSLREGANAGVRPASVALVGAVADVIGHAVWGFVFRFRPAVIISHMSAIPLLRQGGTMALVGKVSFVVGLVIAVAGGLGFEQTWFGWALAVLGLIVGFLNISNKESQTFLLAAIALIVAANAVGAIPYVGEGTTRIIANLVLFLGGAVLVVAVKSLFAVARD